MTETSATESRKPRLPAAQLRRCCRWWPLVCGLLALWLAWSGWEQYRAGTRETALLQARDSAAQTVGTAVGKELAAARRTARQRAGAGRARQRRPGRRLAGRSARAGPEQKTVEVLAPDLDAAYAALPRPATASSAVAEAALATDKPVAWVVRDGGSPQLGLAAPARGGQALAGVAYVRLPLNACDGRASTGANVDDDSYLALRQGSHSVVERGDKALATGAESLATPVPGSDLARRRGVAGRRRRPVRPRRTGLPDRRRRAGPAGRCRAARRASPGGARRGRA